MIKINDKKYYSANDVKKVVRKKLEAYYHEYVEELEIDHDQLLDKTNELEELLQSARMDADRYRTELKKVKEEKKKIHHELAVILQDISEGRLRRWKV